CTLLKADYWPASVLGPFTTHLLKADYWPASMLGPRQLALSVEFLFEILYVGAPGAFSFG
ncbi:hypothetical protein EDM28_13640, partial [Staphylococcus aureus]